MRDVNRQPEASPAVSPETPLAPPLVVDLDGTLLLTDLLHESALLLLKQKPWAVLLIPLWLIRGRAYLKHRIFEFVRPDCDLLPMHEELLAWLRSEKESGRRLVLATASDQRLAEQTVDRLDLFNLVLGSDQNRNLKGRRKLEVVTKICGAQFDYAGNSSADYPLWQASREAIVVNASKAVESTARRSARVTRVFDPPPNQLKSAVGSLRLSQWVMNVLIFLSALTSQAGRHWPVMLRCATAFLAFGVCASGVYVIKELLRLDEDRRHSNNRNRPFASGTCSILTGVILAGVCVLAGLGLAVAPGGVLLPLLLVDICLTFGYSLQSKKPSFVGVLLLALLCTVRLVAGYAVTGIPFPAWLPADFFGARRP